MRRIADEEEDLARAIAESLQVSGNRSQLVRMCACERTRMHVRICSPHNCQLPDGDTAEFCNSRSMFLLKS